MAAPDRFIAWCKQEHASIEQQLSLLQGGKVHTGEDTGAGWVDTTADSIKRAKARLAEGSSDRKRHRDRCKAESSVAASAGRFLNVVPNAACLPLMSLRSLPLLVGCTVRIPSEALAHQT